MAASSARLSPRSTWKAPLGGPAVAFRQVQQGGGQAPPRVAQAHAGQPLLGLDERPAEVEQEPGADRMARVQEGQEVVALDKHRVAVVQPLSRGDVVVGIQERLLPDDLARVGDANDLLPALAVGPAQLDAAAAPDVEPQGRGPFVENDLAGLVVVEVTDAVEAVEVEGGQLAEDATLPRPTGVAAGEEFRRLTHGCPPSPPAARRGRP